MNKFLCKNLQDIDRNNNVKFGVCKCYWSGDLWLSEGEKNHFENTTFKNMYWNLLTQIDKVLEKKHLTVSFGCFLSTSLKKTLYAQNLKLDKCMKKLCFCLLCLPLRLCNIQMLAWLLNEVNIQCQFVGIFCSFRSRLALAAQGATFGVSKDIMSFQTWLLWQRA